MPERVKPVGNNLVNMRKFITSCMYIPVLDLKFHGTIDKAICLMTADYGSMVSNESYLTTEIRFALYNMQNISVNSP